MALALYFLALLALFTSLTIIDERVCTVKCVCEFQDEVVELKAGLRMSQTECDAVEEYYDPVTRVCSLCADVCDSNIDQHEGVCPTQCAGLYIAVAG